MKAVTYTQYLMFIREDVLPLAGIRFAGRHP
jgi:hypothetical protein